jgi:hypothetical protein
LPINSAISLHFSYSAALSGRQPDGFSTFNSAEPYSTPFRKRASKKENRGQKNKNAASRLVQFDVNQFVISRNSRKFAPKKREKSRKIS